MGRHSLCTIPEIKEGKWGEESCDERTDFLTKELVQHPKKRESQKIIE